MTTLIPFALLACIASLAAAGTGLYDFGLANLPLGERARELHVHNLYYNMGSIDESISALISDSFQAGSGASGSEPLAESTVETERSKQSLTESTVEANWPKQSLTQGTVEAERPKLSLRHKGKQRKKIAMFTVTSPILCILYVIFMMPHGGGGHHGGGSRDFNYRVPPAWSPENESNYSFRA